MFLALFYVVLKCYVLYLYLIFLSSFVQRVFQMRTKYIYIFVLRQHLMVRYKPKRKQAERCQNCCARLNGYVEIYQGTFINFRNRQPLVLGHQYRKIKIYFISFHRNNLIVPNNTNNKSLEIKILIT